MRSEFDDDAQRLIELVKRAEITKREGVLLLVFGRRHSRVVGYLNENPYNAARAMVEFLLETFPDAKRPAWLERRDDGK